MPSAILSKHILFCPEPRHSRHPVVIGWSSYQQYGGTRAIQSAYTWSVDKQIGEGTYGQVFQGNCKSSQDKVALKKIRMDTEKEGFPITAIREIKILSTLQHENVVNLREIVRSESEFMDGRAACGSTPFQEPCWCFGRAQA